MAKVTVTRTHMYRHADRLEHTDCYLKSKRVAVSTLPMQLVSSLSRPICSTRGEWSERTGLLHVRHRGGLSTNPPI